MAVINTYNYMNKNLIIFQNSVTYIVIHTYTVTSLRTNGFNLNSKCSYIEYICTYMYINIVAIDLLYKAEKPSVCLHFSRHIDNSVISAWIDSGLCLWLGFGLKLLGVYVY